MYREKLDWTSDVFYYFAILIKGLFVGLDNFSVDEEHLQ